MPKKKKAETLGLIVARGGSKGLPRKNIMPAAGRPLIAWTIKAAQESPVVDAIVLSSDDEEIMEVAASWGCEVPFRRPAALANDSASSMDVVMDALNRLPGYEFVILLQPTSPLRTAADIDAAFALLKSRGAPSCVSVSQADQSPYWMYRMKEGGEIENLIEQKNTATRRQDLPPAYVLNGAIYIAKIEWLRRTKSFVANGCIAYEMPKARSIDIDTEADFEDFRRTVEGG